MQTGMIIYWCTWLQTIINPLQMEKTFEDYLADIHAKGYVGLDDDMSDNCIDWVENLDTQELIEYADMYGQSRFVDGMTHSLNQLKAVL